MVNTSTCPPPLRALARRVVRVLLAASPHLPQWARRVPRPMTPAPAPHNGRHTTCPQPHEQLLMGWIAGEMAAMMMGGSNKRGGGRTTPHHPPPASQATARGVGCGWNDNDASNGEGQQQQHRAPRYPPPRLRATARRVDDGCGLLRWRV
jgi:hypothetical protein